MDFPSRLKPILLKILRFSRTMEEIKLCGLKTKKKSCSNSTKNMAPVGQRLRRSTSVTSQRVQLNLLGEHLVHKVFVTCGKITSKRCSTLYQDPVMTPRYWMTCSLKGLHHRKWLHEAIASLKSGKSPGPDNLVFEHFKHADHTVIVLLSILFNSCLVHGFLPAGLMDTVIVPIVKNPKGDVTCKDNYRPIALTSVLSKILEKLILKRCSTFLDSTDNQFGFKPNSSTDLCVFTLKQVIDYYKCNGSPVYMCFLDASKAFDRVQHDLLFSKLIDRNVPQLIVRLLMYWYSSQTFVIRWGHHYSDCFMVSNGVRQGSVLSPTLFNVYIDILSLKLSQSCIGCTFNSQCYNHLVYADDTVLLAPSPTALQKLINICTDFAYCHGLVYNEEKTKYMVIKPAAIKNLHIPSVSLNNSAIKLVSREKYLGFIIKDDCCDNDHIMQEMRNTFTRGSMLIRNFKHCSDDVKVKLYRAYCSSIYCCGLICVYHKTVIKKLHVAFNKIFKCFMNVHPRSSASSLFVSLNVANFLVLRRKLVFSFLRRVSLSCNSLIVGIFNSNHFLTCQLKKKWDSILYK